MLAEREQVLLKGVSNRRLARTGKTGEPDHFCGLVLLSRTNLLGDFVVMLADVAAASKHVANHARTDCRHCDAIDQDEVSLEAVLFIRSKSDRGIRGELHQTDVVRLEGACRFVIAIVDVQDMADAGHNRRHLGGA